MPPLDDLTDRVERLVLRHQELKRTTALMAQQLVTVTAERDSLRSRLAAARARVDALIERLPLGTEPLMPGDAAPPAADPANPIDPAATAPAAADDGEAPRHVTATAVAIAPSAPAGSLP